MKNVCVEGYKVALSNDDGDVNENGNNAIGIDWQNNNLECKDH